MICDYCGNPIGVGETYFDDEGWILHKHCVSKIRKVAGEAVRQIENERRRDERLRKGHA